MRPFWHFPLGLLIFLPLFLVPISTVQPPACHPIYVRWPRVRLNNQGGTKSTGPSLSFGQCQNACTGDMDPLKKGTALQCSAMNHRAGLGSYGQECQIFSREHVQHTDGYMEADDRYTFYWKFCLDTPKTCTGDYAFTFLSDRYMLKSEVSSTRFTRSLEDCLAECLKDSDTLCRSVSFNRTDGGCHLSEQNQLSKPTAIRINNNPNYRIDYYENNCYNNSFKFTPICEPNGIRVQVSSRIPYSGALYGLYDFFSCRIEPKEEKQFELLFPFPHLARNCSDSYRQSGNEILLEIVLSTDGVEPLYFITADDLTFQARCPLPKLNGSSRDRWQFSRINNGGGEEAEKQGATINSILEALSSAAVEPNLRRFGPSTSADRTFGGSSTDTASTNSLTAEKGTSSWSSTSRPYTKDVFTLPLYTVAESGIGTTAADGKEELAKFSYNSQLGKEDEQLTTQVVLFEASIGSSTDGSSTTPSSTPSNGQQKEVSLPLGSSTARAIKPTTIVVQQQPALDEKPSALKPSETTGTRTKLGMEPIFEEEDYSLYSSNSSPSTPLASVSSSPALDERTTEYALKSTTKRSADDGQWEEGRKKFTFSTHLAFGPDQILMRTGANDAREGGGVGDVSGTSSSTRAAETSSTGSTSTQTSTATSTTASTTSSSSSTTSSSSTSSSSSTKPTGQTAPSTPVLTAGSQPEAPTTRETVPRSEFGSHANFGGSRPGSSAQREKIIFEVFHNGQPAEAVVVGSRITLAFTPYFAIPPTHMSISGCQVEPIGSLYEWEKEPLAIIKDGCQADHVGLVCPPQKTDYGIRVTVEAFRYQTTTQVQYTCLVRVCPFAPCPQVTCPAVEGCSGDDIVSRTLGLNRRAKRGDQQQQRPSLDLNGIRNVLTALQHDDERQEPWNGSGQLYKMNSAVQQQLIQLGGDSILRRRLIVVNSEDELRYYAKTGEVPHFRPGT